MELLYSVGESRCYTADVDFSILVEAGKEEETAGKLLTKMTARVPDPVAFASRTRVLLAQAENGIAVDIVLAGLPYEARVLERASD